MTFHRKQRTYMITREYIIILPQNIYKIRHLKIDLRFKMTKVKKDVKRL